MSKRRTRKDKQKADHGYLLTWNNPSENRQFEAGVKRQIKNEPSPDKFTSSSVKNANVMAKEDNLKFLKKDILKSLILATLILSLEVVLYLVWR